MVVKVLECQTCGNRFEFEVLDQEDPRERDRPGDRVRCPNCSSIRLKPIRTLRRVRMAR